MFEDQVALIEESQGSSKLALFHDLFRSYLHILDFYTLLGHLSQLQHGQPKLRASGGALVESDGAASDLSAYAGQTMSRQTAAM